MEGVHGIDDMMREYPKLSLVLKALMGKPTGPMLIVGGAKDTQVPISDLDLLVDNGNVPKDAWINPQGGYLGRKPKVRTNLVIFRKVFMPWELRLIQETAN